LHLFPFGVFIKYQLYKKEYLFMYKIKLKITDGRDLRFTGELIHGVASSGNNAMPYYSGVSGQWTELDIYKTKGGKFVCHRSDLSECVMDKEHFSGAVCENHDEIIAFFGHGELQAWLYHNANIDDAIEVD
jgi:hypothetical protein